MRRGGAKKVAGLGVGRDRVVEGQPIQHNLGHTLPEVAGVWRRDSGVCGSHHGMVIRQKESLNVLGAKPRGCVCGATDSQPCQLAFRRRSCLKKRLPPIIEVMPRDELPDQRRSVPGDRGVGVVLDLGLEDRSVRITAPRR